MGLSNRTKFKEKYISEGLLEMTILNKPNSSLHKYFLTYLGRQLKNNFDI